MLADMVGDESDGKAVCSWCAAGLPDEFAWLAVIDRADVNAEEGQEARNSEEEEEQRQGLMGKTRLG